MKLDESFFEEEVRCGFPVTRKRKKVWAAEMRILEKFDEVCRKYNLTYFAYYGTLLGAVRHQGFIPWDDDIDVAMFRDDYEKLKEVAAMEFAEPYFFQNTYTDQMLWTFSKIRDSRTTAVEFLEMPELNQGIFIDIFPLDDVPNGKNDEFSAVKDLQKLLWCMITDPEPILSNMKKGKTALLDPQFLMEYIQKDIVEQFKIFEEFNLAQFGKTDRVDFILDEMQDHEWSVKREWLQNIVYLPFENMQIPAPAEYDKILTRQYGNYRQFVMGGSAHEGIILDPDMSYTEYFRRRKGQKTSAEEG